MNTNKDPNNSNVSKMFFRRNLKGCFCKKHVQTKGNKSNNYPKPDNDN